MEGAPVRHTAQFNRWRPTATHARQLCPLERRSPSSLDIVRAYAGCDLFGQLIPGGPIGSGRHIRVGSLRSAAWRLRP